MVDMLTLLLAANVGQRLHSTRDATHDEQRKALQMYESNGCKSPYQSEADGIEQAHRLADGYNRQFLRVLRQLRT